MAKTFLQQHHNSPSLGKVHRGKFGDALRGFRHVFYSVGAFSCAVNVLLLVHATYMLQVYDRVITSRNDVTL